VTRIFIAIAAAALAFIPSAYALTAKKLTGPFVEADNGLQYALGNIAPYPGGGVEAEIYALRGPGEPVLPNRMLFDCRGNMYDGSWAYIPPRSVANKLAQIACARTHS
jgi:hypothetical protein